MKFKEFLEMNAPLTQSEHKQLNFRVFYYAFFLLPYFIFFQYYTFHIQKKTKYFIP